MKRGERGFCCALLVLSLALLCASLQITPLPELTLTSDGAYPVFVSVLCVGFALWMVLENQGKATVTEKPVLHRDVVTVLLLLVLYVGAILLIHYILATLLFTVLSITYLERGNWRLGLLVGFISTFMIVLLFKYAFNVILP